MTVDPPASEPGLTGRRPPLERAASGPEAMVCPFLRSADGAWSSAVASRDLRCWAVRPPAMPTVHKQRQLCLVAAHGTCATFGAAMAADPPLRSPDSAGTSLWPDVATTPVALEAVRTRGGSPGASQLAGSQALLVGLMLTALVVLVVAKANPLAGQAPVEPPGASAVATAPGASGALGPSGGPAPTPSQSAVASAADTPSPAAPSPTVQATPSPGPTAAQRTYTVRSGDTLSGIAAKHGTTVAAIVKANSIKDPRTIHPGQVLILP